MALENSLELRRRVIERVNLSRAPGTPALFLATAPVAIFVAPTVAGGSLGAPADPPAEPTRRQTRTKLRKRSEGPTAPLLPSDAGRRTARAMSVQDLMTKGFYNAPGWFDANDIEEILRGEPRAPHTADDPLPVLLCDGL